MLNIDGTYYLDEHRASDADRLAEVINDPEIARNTLTIPYPYTKKDAEFWLQLCEQQQLLDLPQKQWVIRNRDGELCGGIGLHFKYGTDSHKDEIGYWLMRDLWGKGLMTTVVQKFVEFCTEERGLLRLEAPVFEFNTASAAVLKKNGFELEGRLRKAYFKEGRFFDSLFYAKVTE
ncbi:MAG: GNAT family N-acetyltransferase [Flavobacteriales bacterium]|nr:GNAT family N-acetyltransferase [Flavobacteriales bacterium]